jgi:enoyl-CoA hydratase/carnithine racemase
VTLTNSADFFEVEEVQGVRVLRLLSGDGMNRLTRARVRALTLGLQDLTLTPRALILTGNRHFFSVGADLNEIAELTGPAAYEFSLMGQTLMNAIEHFPAPVYAAISGYCMGGGLDLALACHRRVAAPDAVLGHRGAALGLITGWGGTQRMPRLVGKAKALEMFVVAKTIPAGEALRIGLVDAVDHDPLGEAARRISFQHRVTE